MSTGRWVRLLLLLSTLVGLAAMHTLGHGAHAPGGHSAGHAEAQHGARPAAAPDEVGMTDGCAADDCRHAAVLPLGDLGDDPSGWTVCLAVLGAFAVALLVAVLLRARSRVVGPALRGALRLAAGPRAPPPRPFGLRLATASVLRR
ncbi:hypothetical protein GA0070624_1435 [Micromonospora rhizosphaerae]|uniref:Uncharacterized protein n=1 Tax=Micromonospora rhizosphaerae TaxID=568872 RepID=A0A1C6RLJ8_9ACTN|nr:hypothetical protein GA0070624_1435 [Micromonospora rhizosphaerae]